MLSISWSTRDNVEIEIARFIAWCPECQLREHVKSSYYAVEMDSRTILFQRKAAGYCTHDYHEVFRLSQPRMFFFRGLIVPDQPEPTKARMLYDVVNCFILESSG